MKIKTEILINKITKPCAKLCSDSVMNLIFFEMCLVDSKYKLGF